jgi:hypothetical protein
VGWWQRMRMTKMMMMLLVVNPATAVAGACRTSTTIRQLLLLLLLLRQVEKSSFGLAEQPVTGNVGQITAFGIVIANVDHHCTSTSVGNQLGLQLKDAFNQQLGRGGGGCRVVVVVVVAGIIVMRIVGFVVAGVIVVVVVSEQDGKVVEIHVEPIRIVRGQLLVIVPQAS